MIKGFTLVEVMIVVALAALGVVFVTGAVIASHGIDGKHKSIIGRYAECQEACLPYVGELNPVGLQWRCVCDKTKEVR